uniref:Nudix hydrolase domain-containing protein n=1 Tax=Anopheles funestus TaxID=62324 RepID=A0A182RRA2_ANOFN
MRRFAKFWRESASLIVLARDGSKSRADVINCNYKVLVLERPARTSFMPNAVVFPGGAFDKQDSAFAWNTLLPATKTKPLTKVSGPRSFIFDSDSPQQLDRNISLRLCAIRETFEELGILLAKRFDESNRTGYGTVVKCDLPDIICWQKNIHEGLEQFRQLCDRMKIVPDVLNLYEWSTWITPTILHKKRFETVFYLIALDTLPNVLPESTEVKQYFWDTPRNLLEAHDADRIWLSPPQAYELKRLSYLEDIDQVVEFARTKRFAKGTTPLCPVAFTASDGVVLALPGDSLYPANYDFVTEHSNAKQYVHQTMEELRQNASLLHRLELVGKLHAKGFYQNQPALDEHLHLMGNNGQLVK